MNDETSLPERKLRLLGNILLVVACLGALAGLISIPLSFSLSSPPDTVEDPEIQDLVDQAFLDVALPEGFTLETTVRELLEHDRAFFTENRAKFRTLSLLSAAIPLLGALIFLRLALAWRKAIPFGRPTIIGLRCLGLLLIVQFVVGWAVVSFVTPPGLIELFFWSDLYHDPVEMLGADGPILSSGILFLILSWVLDYGRRIKEEQALTI